MTFDTIVIDLDGTIVDTAPDIARVLSLVLAEADLPRADEAETIDLVGGGLAALMARAFGRRGDPDAEARALARAARFVQLALEAPAPNSRVYAAVPETLAAWRKRGCRLAVCTNKTEALARAVLDAVGLLPMLDGVVGGGDLPKKPDPAPMLEAVRRAGGDPRRAVMVGDSETDLLAARAAEMPCVLVSYGYNHGKLPDLEPDAVVGAFAEVPAALARLEARR